MQTTNNPPPPKKGPCHYGLVYLEVVNVIFKKEQLVFFNKIILIFVKNYQNKIVIRK